MCLCLLVSLKRLQICRSLALTGVATTSVYPICVGGTGVTFCSVLPGEKGQGGPVWATRLSRPSKVVCETYQPAPC